MVLNSQSLIINAKIYCDARINAMTSDFVCLEEEAAMVTYK